ncbi:hypothetical protein PTKIN_Ptkin04bG0176000 [Pterospermum kingtungense]
MVVVVEIVLFGVDDKQMVKPWLWALVDDRDQWETFPWGKFVFSATLHYLNAIVSPPPPPPPPLEDPERKKKFEYHFYGFPLAFQLWVYEAIPELGRTFATCLDYENPLSRFRHWKMKRVNKKLDNIFDRSLECFSTLVPSPLEQTQGYLLDIKQLITESIQYVHPEQAVVRTSNTMITSGITATNVRSSDPASRHGRTMKRKRGTNDEDNFATRRDSSVPIGCSDGGSPISGDLPTMSPPVRDELPTMADDLCPPSDGGDSRHDPIVEGSIRCSSETTRPGPATDPERPTLISLDTLRALLTHEIPSIVERMLDAKLPILVKRAIDDAFNHHRNELSREEALDGGIPHCHIPEEPHHTECDRQEDHPSDEHVTVNDPDLDTDVGLHSHGHTCSRDTSDFVHTASQIAVRVGNKDKHVPIGPIIPPPQHFGEGFDQTDAHSPVEVDTVHVDRVNTPLAEEECEVADIVPESNMPVVRVRKESKYLRSSYIHFSAKKEGVHLRGSYEAKYKIFMNSPNER